MNLREELVEAMGKEIKHSTNVLFLDTLRAHLRDHGTLFSVAIPTETADPGPLREWLKDWVKLPALDLGYLIVAHERAIDAMLAALGEKE